VPRFGVKERPLQLPPAFKPRSAIHIGKNVILKAEVLLINSI
jgi:hypothetical protein